VRLGVFCDLFVLRARAREILAEDAPRRLHGNVEETVKALDAGFSTDGDHEAVLWLLAELETTPAVRTRVLWRRVFVPPLHRPRVYGAAGQQSGATSPGLRKMRLSRDARLRNFPAARLEFRL
jgi:hypothetical protein